MVFVELLRRGGVFFGGVEFLSCLVAPVVAGKEFQLQFAQLMFLGDEGVSASRGTFAGSFGGVLRVRSLLLKGCLMLFAVLGDAPQFVSERRVVLLVRYLFLKGCVRHLTFLDCVVELLSKRCDAPLAFEVSVRIAFVKSLCWLSRGRPVA